MFENKEKDKNTILLYSTAGCHLCEIANGLLKSVSLEHPFTLKIVDIANNDRLFEKYGIRIPVIKFEHADQELGWPFDIDELQDFLRQD